MSKPVQRFLLWACIFAAGLIIVLLFVNYSRNREFRAAGAWHTAHGNFFLFDGHRINLPQDWWERSEDVDGKHFAVKASRDLAHTSQCAITVDRKGVEETKRSDAEIRKTLESIVRKEKEGGAEVTQSRLVVVSASSTNMYCLRTLLERKELELRCDVVRTPIVITAIGPPESEKEIESILSTFD